MHVLISANYWLYRRLQDEKKARFFDNISGAVESIRSSWPKGTSFYNPSTTIYSGGKLETRMFQTRDFLFHDGIIKEAREKLN